MSAILAIDPGTTRSAWVWMSDGVIGMRGIDANDDVLEQLVGLHHHCDNPPCCNPRHLYLGDHQQNMLDAVARGRQASVAKTHCPQGHPYDAENTYIVPRTGHRQCRACRAIRRAAEARARRMAA